MERNRIPTELHRNNLFLRLMYADRAVMKQYRPIIWDKWYEANKEKNARKGHLLKHLCVKHCTFSHIFSCLTAVTFHGNRRSYNQKQ